MKISIPAQAILRSNDPEEILRDLQMIITGSLDRGLRGYVASIVEQTAALGHSGRLYLAGDERGIPQETWEWLVPSARLAFESGPEYASFPKDLAGATYFRRVGVSLLDPREAAWTSTTICSAGLSRRVMADLLRDSVAAWPERYVTAMPAYVHLKTPIHAIKEALSGFVQGADVEPALWRAATGRHVRQTRPDPGAMSQLADWLEGRGVKERVLLEHLRGRECCPICVGGVDGDGFCMGCHFRGGWREPTCPGCTGEGCNACGDSGRVPYLHGAGCWAADVLHRWLMMEKK